MQYKFTRAWENFCHIMHAFSSTLWHLWSTISAKKEWMPMNLVKMFKYVLKTTINERTKVLPKPTQSPISLTAVSLNIRYLTAEWSAHYALLTYCNDTKFCIFKMYCACTYGTYVDWSTNWIFIQRTIV